MPPNCITINRFITCNNDKYIRPTTCNIRRAFKCTPTTQHPSKHVNTYASTQIDKQTQTHINFMTYDLQTVSFGRKNEKWKKKNSSWNVTLSSNGSRK